MRAILVGAGGVGRELLRRLGDMWDVTVVDSVAERLQRAGGLRRIEAVEGDGSSRVVLTRAGLAGTDALIAATDDDRVNLEACRIARQADVHRLVAVANDPERIPDFQDLGAAAIAPDSLAARRVELNLESRRVFSMAFAGGRAEAIEFRIAHDSPVRGRALKELYATSWIVGAVLRDDELIIPHGDTVLRTGDLVTVVGAGADFASIVRTFSSGESRFPLDHGKRVAVALEAEPEENGSVAEAIYLVRNSQATALVLVFRDPHQLRDETEAARAERFLERASGLAEGVEIRPRPVRDVPSRALALKPEQESIGVLVVAAPGGARRPVRRGVRLVRRTERPVLLARGTFPYRRILVPARDTEAGRVAVRAAIDLARFGKASLIGLSVLDPEFFSGPSEPREQWQPVGWLEEEAAVQGIDVEGRVERGNPIREIVRQSERADLVVLGLPLRRGPRLRSDLARMIAYRTRRSVLLVPVPEGD
jgi:hypothetical protein